MKLGDVSMETGHVRWRRDVNGRVLNIGLPVLSLIKGSITLPQHS